MTRAELDGNDVVLRRPDGGTVQLVGHRGPVTAVDFSSDGTRVATSSEDNDARVWDARTGKALPALRGHFNAVRDVDFSPDGRWLVTAGPTTAALWDARSGDRLFYLYGHAKPSPQWRSTNWKADRNGRRRRPGSLLPLRALRHGHGAARGGTAPPAADRHPDGGRARDGSTKKPDASARCSSSFALLVSALNPAWRTSFAPDAASDHVSSRPVRRDQAARPRRPPPTCRCSGCT